MGYRAEKERKERERKKLRAVLLVLFLIAAAGLTLVNYFTPIESWKYYFALPEISARAEGELRVHFLDVGQADSTLIEFPDGQTMLIDGGDVDGDKAILRYLNALKIERLDYILLTHTDSDHCGSLATVMEYKEVGRVFLPFAQGDETEKAAFQEFVEVLEKNDVESEIAKRYTSVESSDERYPYTFCILFPYSSSSGGNGDFYDNQLSTIAWLDYQGVSALFCGDTSASVLSKLVVEDELGAFSLKNVDLASTEILKVPHHGSQTAVNSAILEYLNVQTAVISCGKNNYYGHPSGETLAALSALEIETYRTDWRGNILLTVQADGTKRFSCEK